MRISRVYLDQPLSAESTVTVAGDAAHYLINVLRLKTGTSCKVFNSRDGEFSAEISGQNKLQLVLSLGAPVPVVGNPEFRIDLGLGLSRGERMDYAVQKSVELGVWQITPLLTEHCEVKLSGDRIASRVQHWQRIAINACEQCGRTEVPRIKVPQALGDWLKERSDGMVFDPSGGAVTGAAAPAQPLSLLIGPEGGLSEEELRLAVEQGLTKVRLGPRILRTETAPVAALSVLQYLYGDLSR